jgi:hypothetical protein
MIYVEYTRPSHRGSEVNGPGAINPYVAPCGFSPVAMTHSAPLQKPFSLEVLYSMRSEIDCIAAQEFPLCHEIGSAIGVRLDHHTVLFALPDDLRSRVEKVHKPILRCREYRITWINRNLSSALYRSWCGKMARIASSAQCSSRFLSKAAR